MLTAVLGQEDPLEGSDGASKVGLLQIVARAIVGPICQAAQALVTDWAWCPGTDVVDGIGGLLVEHPETDSRLLIRERVAGLGSEQNVG